MFHRRSPFSPGLPMANRELAVCDGKPVTVTEMLVVTVAILSLQANEFREKSSRKLPETAWVQDISSGCFDLRSSRLAGTRAALKMTSQKGLVKLRHYSQTAPLP